MKNLTFTTMWKYLIFFFVQVFFVSPLKVETKVINDSIVKIMSMHQCLKDKFLPLFQTMLILSVLLKKKRFLKSKNYFCHFQYLFANDFFVSHLQIFFCG